VNAEGRRLLVIGDALLDRDVHGSVERVCPDAPVPVVDVREVRERPGGAGLAALTAARAGARVTLAAGVGGDAAGDRLRTLLSDLEVHAVLHPSTTPGKTRVRAQGQSILRLDDAGHLLGGVDVLAELSDDGGGEVDEKALERLVLSSDAVLVADYGGPVARNATVRSVLERLAGHVPIVWDPHPRGGPPVPGTRVVTPNRLEAQGFADSDGDSLEVVAGHLRRSWAVHAVVVTDGERGAVVLDGEDPAIRCAAGQCPDVVDTCGAGDRFAGALALALARGSQLVDAVREATSDVGRWLQSGGVATCSGTGADTDLGSPGPTDGPVDSPPSAAELATRVRASGGTVVATGGCFDVLHAGHLALLEAARALGDCLVVLINSDAGVRRLKGDRRPVNGAADRARLLEALRCVDAVAVFEDDDPSATLARLRPEVWVKGGDYAVADLPEAPVVHSYGGRVQIVPLLGGRSTTSVLARVDAANPSGPRRR
jgi:D-beta-D-heptose 7-phosphate kinase / D-beta-D-heptose 1-phosphate adenosyltransferase